MESKVEQVEERRSGGYLPSVWDHEFINSLTTPYTYESHGNRLEELRQAAQSLFTSLNRPEEKLDMINIMQRLNVAKHVDKEIKEFLSHLNPNAATDLFTAALQFRLLRQDGFVVSSDVFNKFMNGDGKLKESLSEDVAGLLSLYEASYLGVHGEDDVLEEANAFTTKHLELAMEKMEKDLAWQIKESLEVPLYWRMPRMEARNFIDIYQSDGNKKLALLELAQLEFNLSQSIYLQELKELAEWWEGLNMKEKLPFARDRMVECYFWAMGSVPDPKFYKCRRNITKYGSLVTVIDDVYDVYGSIDELQIFTTAIKRWDVEAIEELPEYMKVLYKAMYNHVNEMVEDALNDFGIDILPYVKDQWVTYIESLQVEAEWYYGGYMPTLDEYLKNGWISVGASPGLAYAFLAVLQASDSFNPSHLQILDRWKDSDLFYWPCLITRTVNDLKTSEFEEMEKGEMTKSIQCYMKQEGVCEEEARHHLNGLVSESWKMLNKSVFGPYCIPKGFAEIAVAMTRCCQRMYQCGDIFNIQGSANIDCVTSSLYNPV